MAEYIDKQALLNEIAELHMKHKLPDNEEMLFTESDIRGLVACLPTAEVEPVRHGRLSETGMDEAWCSWGDCSACGRSNIMGAKYCNWCGVKLDGGADNG